MCVHGCMHITFGPTCLQFWIASTGMFVTPCAIDTTPCRGCFHCGLGQSTHSLFSVDGRLGQDPAQEVHLPSLVVSQRCVVQRQVTVCLCLNIIAGWKKLLTKCFSFSIFSASLAYVNLFVCFSFSLVLLVSWFGLSEFCISNY